MKRTVLLLSIILIATLISGWVNLADAHHTGKVHRIGYLSVRKPDTEKSYLPAFQQGLRELGYVEGNNIVIEYRWAERRGRKRQSDLAAELLRHKVELVVTGGGGAASAVRRLSKTIPIVMAEATAPVARGLVQSLAQPGGNTTGLSLMSPELFGKWLELLKEVVPNLSAVAVLWSPKSTTSRLGWNNFLELSASFSARAARAGLRGG